MFCDRDIICFLGDSITANGLWMAEAYQYLRKKYQVKCYNCGVSGATTTQAVHYLYSRCLSYNPDYVVMMYGINDIWRHLYGEWYRGNKDVKADIDKALRMHKENYEALVKETVAFGAKPILCIAVPYDEVSDGEEENMHCQWGMDLSAAFVREMAEKYDCPVVDFKSVMYPMLKDGNILSADRVHPTPEGYHVMAQVFLKDVGEIEEMDFETPFVWEDWNMERYDIEKVLHKINFVEFCALHEEKYIKKMTIGERKQIAAQRYEEAEDKTTFIPQAYREYAEKAEESTMLLSEVVKKTVF